MEVHLDFEWRSRIDLKAAGIYRVAEDPSTEILCARWRIDGGPLRSWSPFFGDEPPQDLLDAVAAGATVVAHSAPAEYCMWNIHCVPRHGWPPLPFDQMQDTMAACGHYAIPLALDKAAKVLELPVQKDTVGKRAMMALARPQSRGKNKGEFLDPLDNFGLLADTIDYCGIDVDTEIELDRKLGRLPADEERVWRLDQTINERGVQIDLEAVHAAKEVVDQVEAKLLPEFARIVGDGEFNRPTQVEKMRQWCAAQGLTLPNMQADTLVEVLKDKTLPDNLRRVLEIRQILGLASIKKLDAMLACVCANGRARGLLQYHAASTGRWAGRLIQPQNFVRGAYGADPEAIISLVLGRDAELLTAVYGDAVQAVSDALRPMMTAAPGKELIAVDFAAIEAVVLACLAGEQWKVDAFAAINRGEGYNGSDDIYCATAAKMFGRPVSKKETPEDRQTGKVCELAFGYEGGVGAWRGFDDSDKYTDEEVDEFKKSWREEHPMVKALWRGLNDASIKAVLHRTSASYRGITYTLEPCGRLSCRLPSGRRLWYNWPKIEWEYPPWVDPDDDDAEARPVLKYYAWRKNAWRKMDAYGGLDTENVVQAVARDLLVAGMFSCEAGGYPLVLTIHDELIAEVPEGFGSVAEMAALATPHLAWSAGWPVKASGWRGFRYRKD